VPFEFEIHTPQQLRKELLVHATRLQQLVLTAR
jgi:hypothetical protein